MPSGPIPLGLSAEERHATAEDSQSKLVMDGGKRQNAPTRPLFSTPPSGDIQGAPRPTQPLLGPVAMEVRSPDPTTVNLVTLVDRKCNHPILLAHRGRFPARPVNFAQTYTWVPPRHKGCSVNPLSSPLPRHRSAHPLIGGGGSSLHQNKPTRHASIQLPSIQTIADWIHLLHSHTHEEFANIVESLSDDTCTLCYDTLGMPFYVPPRSDTTYMGEAPTCSVSLGS